VRVLPQKSVLFSCLIGVPIRLLNISEDRCIPNIGGNNGEKVFFPVLFKRWNGLSCSSFPDENEKQRIDFCFHTITTHQLQQNMQNFTATGSTVCHYPNMMCPSGRHTDGELMMVPECRKDCDMNCPKFNQDVAKRCSEIYRDRVHRITDSYGIPREFVVIGDSDQFILNLPQEHPLNNPDILDRIAKGQEKQADIVSDKDRTEGIPPQ
jgi:hypothetical protein